MQKTDQTLCDIKNNITSIIRSFTFEFVDDIFFTNLNCCVDNYLSRLMDEGTIKNYGIFFHIFSLWGMIDNDFAELSNPKSRPVVISRGYIYDILRDEFIERGTVLTDFSLPILRSVIKEKLDNLDIKISPSQIRDSSIKMEIAIFVNRLTRINLLC